MPFAASKQQRERALSAAGGTLRVAFTGVGIELWIGFELLVSTLVADELHALCHLFSLHAARIERAALRRVSIPAK